jgi:hypothetical protein
MASQKYPGASTAYWYQSKWGGDSMKSNVIVWHTTEGTSLPGYDDGAMAPNFTAKPDFAAKRLVWYQHFDFDTSSRALVHAGSVATNTLNVCQVEIVGTCDPSSHKSWTNKGIAHLYTPELPDWAIRDLGEFSKWAHDEHGVPLTCDVKFRAYPDSYGTNNGVRMSNSKWLAYRGHCGHEHVPSGNVHGDPGAFPMDAILSAAKNGGTDEEDPLAGMTKADIYDAVWATDKVTAPADAPDVKTNPTWQPQSFLKDTNTRVRSLEKQLAALTKTNSALVDTVAKLASGIGNIDPTAIVNELKAAIESIDVHLDVAD